MLCYHHSKNKKQHQKNPNVTRHTHLVSSGKNLSDGWHRGEKSHIFKVPKGENVRTKGKFHFCVSLVESWTCLPATNLTLSFKLHLTLGWGRGKRASAQIPRVWKMETLTRIRNFSMTALAADSFACLSIIKLSSLKSERQTSRDGLDLGDNC